MDNVQRTAIVILVTLITIGWSGLWYSIGRQGATNERTATVDSIVAKPDGTYNLMVSFKYSRSDTEGTYLRKAHPGTAKAIRVGGKYIFLDVKEWFFLEKEVN